MKAPEQSSLGNQRNSTHLESLETARMMFLPSKKDLKTALEVFAVFQWPLSVFLIGESSAFGRVTNCPGMPGTEGF